MVSKTPRLTGHHIHRQLFQKSIVLVCALILSIACLVPTAYRNDEPFVEPTTKDIVGLWSRSPCNPPESDIINEHSLCTWEFKDDGSFKMVDVPEWFTMSGEWNRAGNSGKGSWEIKRNVQGDWVIALDFDRLNGSGVEETYRELYIHFENPEYLLFVYVGDGDSGRTMVFEKQK